MTSSVPAAGAPSPSPLEVALAVVEAVPRPVEVRLVVPVGPPRHRQALVVARAPRVQRGAEARYLSQKADNFLRCDREYGEGDDKKMLHLVCMNSISRPESRITQPSGPYLLVF